MAIDINYADYKDAEALHGMVLDLADYEGAVTEVKTTALDYARDMLLEEPPFTALIASEDQAPIGFSLFYDRYSTWEGRSVHIEDIYVAPTHRGEGVGRMLIGAIAQHAQEQGVTRIDLEVLDWNKRAEGIYRQLGATMRGDWNQMRFERGAIVELAGTS